MRETVLILDTAFLQLQQGRLAGDGRVMEVGNRQLLCHGVNTSMKGNDGNVSQGSYSRIVTVWNVGGNQLEKTALKKKYLREGADVEDDRTASEEYALVRSLDPFPKDPICCRGSYMNVSMKTSGPFVETYREVELREG